MQGKVQQDAVKVEKQIPYILFGHLSQQPLPLSLVEPPISHNHHHGDCQAAILHLRHDAIGRAIS